MGALLAHHIYVELKHPQMPPPPLLLLLLFIYTCLIHAHSTTNNSPHNLLDNGSFEFGHYDNSSTNSNYLIATAPFTQITGWFLQNGTIDWAQGRWQMASDCSLSCIDLSGAGPGTITTSFLASAHTLYTLLLDAAANPDGPSPLNGSFSLSVQSSLNPNITFNSSLIAVAGEGYDEANIGWRTSSLIFTTSNASMINITLESHIQGYYGPLIDNVRVYEGLFSIDNSLASAASCKASQKEGSTSKSSNASLVVSIIVPVIVGLSLCAGLFLFIKHKNKESQAQDAVILHIEGRATIFPFGVLKYATRNFHPDCKLGQGGFGSVFKGVLPDGTEVAVKQLSPKSSQGQSEFLNEVTVISRVQHRNLVILKGCCMKRDERLLVYEFLENRSLHQALWDKHKAVHLDWPTRFKILIGTARGLTYLHEDSQARIVHRDIKASNILLDKNLNPKIADFGLARFFLDDQTHVSTRVAGTIGYLAPEYALRGQLTEKADVFSFGVLALEVVSGRPNMDNKLPMETQYLLDWASHLHDEERILDLVDPKLEDRYSEEEFLTVLRVAFSCTQASARMRPSMSQVVATLLGEVEMSPASSEAIVIERSSPVPLLASQDYNSDNSYPTGTNSSSNASTSNYHRSSDL